VQSSSWKRGMTVLELKKLPLTNAHLY
jgi:hypothetical protein